MKMIYVKINQNNLNNQNQNIMKYYKKIIDKV